MHIIMSVTAKQANKYINKFSSYTSHKSNNFFFLERINQTLITIYLRDSVNSITY